MGEGSEIVELQSPRLYPELDTFQVKSTASKRRWQIGFKILELILCIVCILVIDDPAHNSRIRVFIDTRTVSLCYITFGSHLILSLVYLIGEWFGDKWSFETKIISSWIAIILFIICAGLLLKNWIDAKNRNFWPPSNMTLHFVLASSIVTGATAVLYVAEAIVLHVNKKTLAK